MYVATPMNSTTGRMTRAKSVNPSPNADACATSARATIAPVTVVRNIPARLNDSFQASERDASRLQCSVERICSRSEGDVPWADATVAWLGLGACSAPSPMPAPVRSKDISAALALSLWSRRHEPIPAPRIRSLGDHELGGAARACSTVARHLGSLRRDDSQRPA